MGYKRASRQREHLASQKQRLGDDISVGWVDYLWTFYFLVQIIGNLRSFYSEEEHVAFGVLDIFFGGNLWGKIGEGKESKHRPNKTLVMCYAYCAVWLEW